MMSHPPYERAIARVERNGTVLGAAFLVSDRHLLTCGHVVGQKDDRVELVFLAHPTQDPVPAQVAAFVGDGDDDVAVIRLDRPVAKAAAAPLARWTTPGDGFSATGFPDNRDFGDPLHGKILGSTLKQQVTLECTSSRRIAPKFSGTGVWSNAHQAIVGMVVSYYPKEPTTAYMIPMGRIAEILEHDCPDLCHDIFRLLSESDSGRSSSVWQPVTPQEVTEIKLCLKDLNVADEVARRLFYEVAPYACVPTGSAEGELFLDSLGTLARRPAEQMLAYVLRGLAYARCKPTPRLEEILQTIASGFALDLGKLGESAQSLLREPDGDGLAVLQIRVAPGLLSNDECQVDAWLREGSSVQPVMETLELPVDQLQKSLPAIVHKAQQQLRNRRSDLQIEVALPLTLLGCELDCWPVKFGAKEKALGSCRQVCVRSYERLYDPEYNMTWFSWGERWEARPDGVAKPQHVLWDDGQTMPEKMLAGKSILVTLQPLTWERLADFVSEGVPIALWPRTKIEDGSAVQAELHEVLYEEPIDGLPERVRKKRQRAYSAEGTSLWITVPLLWDSPDNLPPEALPRAGDDFLPLTAPE